MQRFVYFCTLTLATGLAVAQKNGGSADQMNALQLSHHTGRQVIDIEHVTTIEAPSNAAETMVCHGTFLFSSGVREPGTVTFRKNLAGDPIIVWKSDLAY